MMIFMSIMTPHTLWSQIQSLENDFHDDEDDNDYHFDDDYIGNATKQSQRHCDPKSSCRMRGFHGGRAL